MTIEPFYVMWSGKDPATRRLVVPHERGSQPGTWICFVIGLYNKFIVATYFEADLVPAEPGTSIAGFPSWLHSLLKFCPKPPLRLRVGGKYSRGSDKMAFAAVRIVAATNSLPGHEGKYAYIGWLDQPGGGYTGPYFEDGTQVRDPRASLRLLEEITG